MSLPILILNEIFNDFVVGAFGSYIVFVLLFIFTIAVGMVLLRIPGQFIIVSTGMMIVIFNAIYGGLVLQVLTPIIAVVIGVMIGTGVYHLFKTGV
jgi:hypothetical protein